MFIGDRAKQEFTNHVRANSILHKCTQMMAEDIRWRQKAQASIDQLFALIPRIVRRVQLVTKCLMPVSSNIMFKTRAHMEHEGTQIQTVQ